MVGAALVSLFQAALGLRLLLYVLHHLLISEKSLGSAGIGLITKVSVTYD